MTTANGEAPAPTILTAPPPRPPDPAGSGAASKPATANGGGGLFIPADASLPSYYGDSVELDAIPVQTGAEGGGFSDERGPEFVLPAAASSNGTIAVDSSAEVGGPAASDFVSASFSNISLQSDTAPPSFSKRAVEFAQKWFPVPRLKSWLKFTVAIFIAVGICFTDWMFHLIGYVPVLMASVVAIFHPARTFGEQIQITWLGILGAVAGGIFNTILHVTVSYVNVTYASVVALSLSTFIAMVFILSFIAALACLQYYRFPTFRPLVIMAELVMVSNIFINAKGLFQPNYTGVWIGVSVMLFGLAISLGVNLLIFPDTASSRVRLAIHSSLGLIVHAMNVLLCPPTSGDALAQLRTLSEALHNQSDQLDNLSKSLRYEITFGKVRPRVVIDAATQVGAILSQLGGCAVAARAYWSSGGALDAVAARDRADLESALRDLATVVTQELEKLAPVILNPRLDDPWLEKTEDIMRDVHTRLRRARTRFYAVQNKIIVGETGKAVDPGIPDVAPHHASWDFFTPTASTLNSAFFLLTVRKLARSIDHTVEHMWNTFGHAEPPRWWFQRVLFGGRRLWFPEVEFLKELWTDVNDLWTVYGKDKQSEEDVKSSTEPTSTGAGADLVSVSVSPPTLSRNGTLSENNHEAPMSPVSPPVDPFLTDIPPERLGLTRRRMTVFLPSTSRVPVNSAQQPPVIPITSQNNSAVFNDVGTIRASVSAPAQTAVPKPRLITRVSRRVFSALQSGAAMFALKSVISNTLALLWAFVPFSAVWFDQNNGVWIAITVMLVLQPGLGTTTLAGGLRILGTIIGGVWVALNWFWFPAIPQGLLPLFLPLELAFSYLYLFFPTYSTAGLVGILTWCVIALDGWMFTLEGKQQTMDQFVWFASIRVINVTIGVVICLVGVWFFIPQLSRIEVRSNLSRHLHSQSRVFAAVNELFLSPLIRDGTSLTALNKANANFQRLKSTCRSQLQSLRAQLKAAAGEPDLEIPFNVANYATILQHCQDMLDLMTVMEDMLTSDWTPSNPASQMARRMLGERRRLLAAIMNQFAILEACLMLKEKLPAFSPALTSYDASNQMTARGQQEIERILQERTEAAIAMAEAGHELPEDPSKKLKDATSLLYLFAFGSATRRTVVELDAIEFQAEALFGRESAILQKIFDMD